MADGDVSTKSTICLFDVDGTLTPSRQKITPEMENFLQKLKNKVTVGLVGGSDLCKISEQMAGDAEVIDRYEYVFSENGLVAHKDGKLIGKESVLTFLGEEKCQDFINFALKKLSELKLPCKRGTFIEFRTGLINVCPVGRSCSQAERDQFAAYDKEHHIRQKLVTECKQRFPEWSFVIGGQISFDAFPVGWDKTYCLKYIEKDFNVVHFFGDKTSPGGNDFEIFSSSRTIGHTVTSPEDTKRQLEEIFSL